MKHCCNATYWGYGHDYGEKNYSNNRDVPIRFFVSLIQSESLNTEHLPIQSPDPRHWYIVNILPLVGIVNGLCGHNYEYRTTDIKFIEICMYNKQNNCNIKGKKKNGDKVRKHVVRCQNTSLSVKCKARGNLQQRVLTTMSQVVKR